MTGLLVSVRDLAEARIALDAGVSMIDLKDPSHGALAPVDPRIVAAVVRWVQGRVPVSAALGELRDWDMDSPTRVHGGLAFAKLGLSGCRVDAGLSTTWARSWARAFQSFSPATDRVATVYADWQTAGAPDPFAVLRVARDLACRAVLIDTFNKRAGGLLNCWPLDEVASFVGLARRAGFQVVLGGKLTPSSIENVLPLAPDFIAVRGAACTGTRAGRLDPRRVQRLVRLVRDGQAAVTASRP